MPHAPPGAILRYLRHVADTHSTRALTNAQLLRRFAADREETAFATLMQRHGRLVWDVCRHVLCREQDAEKDHRLRDVAEGQAKAGDIKGALETAGAIEDESDRESAIKEVVTAQLGAGDLKGALKTLESLKRPYWRAEALIEIAKAQTKAGDRDLAGKTFSQAFDAAQGMREQEGHFGNASNACYAHIIRAMAEAGRAKDAADWAAEQRPALLKAQALLCVVEGLALRREAEERAREKK